MATKKVKSLYEESPIKGADLSEINSKLASNMTGTVDVQESDEVEVIDGFESESHFIGGKVPAGFRDTHGDEVTSAQDGQVGALIASLKKIFAPEDGFRYFFKVMDNYRFTILVPLNLSNMDDLTKSIMKADARTVTLVPGNVQAQVEAHAKRVAKHLNYQKDIRA